MISRAANYVKAGTLVRCWGLLNKAQKRYARHLVSKYAYPVQMAIQRVYIFGYDPRPFDYRKQECVTEDVPASAFGFKKSSL